jgi:hypothetical protein
LATTKSVACMFGSGLFYAAIFFVGPAPLGNSNKV